MPEHTQNPYSPPRSAVDREARFRVVGHAAGAIGFFVGLAPSLLVLFSLAEMWEALSDSPSTSVRPVELYLLGFKWLAINVFFCIPLSCGFAKVAQRCGSSLGCRASLWSTVFCPFPVLLSFLGPFVVVWGTGSSFGT